MTLALLTAHIQFFLLNKEGLSENQIVEMQSDPKFNLEIVPLIEDIVLQLKAHGQHLDKIDANKRLLIGTQEVVP